MTSDYASTDTYCRTCGFTDCRSLTEGGTCPRWPAAAPMDLVPEDITEPVRPPMTNAEAVAAGIAELSYAQLAAALATSTAAYRANYRAFVAATYAVDLGIDVEENAAEMRGHLAACEAQAAMTAAILAEIGRRNA